MTNEFLVFVGYSSDAKEEALSIKKSTSQLQKYLDNLNRCSNYQHFDKVKIFNWDYDANLGIGGQNHAIAPYIESANIAIFIFKERVGSVTWEELTNFRNRENKKKIPVIALFPAEPPNISKFKDADFASNWADLLNKKKDLISGWSEPFSKSITPVQPYENISHLKALSLQLMEDLLVSIVSKNREQPTSDKPQFDEIKTKDDLINFDSQTGIFEYDSRAVDRYRDLMRDEVKVYLPKSLSSSEFLTRAGYFREGRLTIAGVLLFSKQPSQLIPSAITRCIKYFGSNKTSPKNRKDLIGPLLDQITQAREFVADTIKKRERPSSLTMLAEIEYEYPMVAVREIVANAICHRRYNEEHRISYIRIFSDRIEVSSPGEWVNPNISLDHPIKLNELVKSESISRNLRLAHAVSKVGIMEMEGSGIPSAVDDCQKVKAPIPTAMERDGFVVIILYPVDDWESSKEDFEYDIRIYRQKAETLFSTLPAAGFATTIKVPINIEDLHVPLHAMVDMSGVYDAKYYDSGYAKKNMATHNNLEISLFEAFQQSEKRNYKGIVILGDPGSGKTTHLKRILLWCLRKGPESLNLPKDMLPVFLPIRELDDLDKGLDAFVQNQLSSPFLEAPKNFGKRLLKRGNLLFLLDGLDEVSNLEKRERVAEWIADALKYYPTCRFVVTCRFAGYSPTVRLNTGFLEMHVRPFTTDQAESFIRNWYTIIEKGLAKDPDQAEIIAKENAESLIQDLKRPNFRSSRIFELTRNPLLLTNICLVHRFRAKLPDKRARLYKECIDVLLEHWRDAKKINIGLNAEDGCRILQPAALWLHKEEGRTRATADELAPHIGPALTAVEWPDGAAEDFLRKIRDESGLLTGWDQEHYGFMHLGFQEYLAAREIRRMAFEDETVLKELASHFGESWWQEVSLLLLALEDPSLFEPYMREVVKRDAFIKYSSLVEACLTDTAERSALPFIELLEQKPGKNKALWARQLYALKIAERLDPEAVDKIKSKLMKHPSADIRHWLAGKEEEADQDIIIAKQGGYELVRIPEDTFLMGSLESEERHLMGFLESEESHFTDECPQHKVHIPEFYIGRYPVTNQEYGLFLKENPKASEPRYLGDRRFNQPKHPVVGVSWDDAQAYAKWADLRLPSEAEWEYACRAGTTSRYYTGDTEKDLARAGWYDKNSDGQTHPVGEKEPNSFGLYDMHGNVYEWVEDDYHDNYNGAPANGTAWIDTPRDTLRGLRGGCWNTYALRCRSSFRNNLTPNAQNNYFGFRLACSQVRACHVRMTIW